MTQDQRNVCERLHKELHAAGVEIGVTITERTQALEVKDFPKVATVSLFVNEPKEKSQQVGNVINENYASGPDVPYQAQSAPDNPWGQ